MSDRRPAPRGEKRTGARRWPDGEAWARILRGTARAIWSDRTTMAASAVAFRITLAVFPGVALLVWIAGHFLGQDAVEAFVHQVTGLMPDSTEQVVSEAVSSSRNHGPSEHGSMLAIGAPLFGLAFTLWSANGGMKALFDALNWVHDERERRGFVRFAALTLAFTAGLVLLLVLTVTLLVAAPVVVSLLPGAAASWLRWMRWPVVFVATAVALGLLGRFAPNRQGERWPWVTVGSVAAALLLLVGSALFSWFMRTFASLSLTYGSLSTVVAFMFWMWISFSVVLAGAGLDACIDKETGLYGGRRGGQANGGGRGNP